MSENYKQYLRHILDESAYIIDTLKHVESFDRLIVDEDKKRALVRSLEIIGEAAKKIPADVKLRWNDIEWKAISGMRDRLIHDYAEVDYDIVWNTVKYKIPDLKLKIERILSENK